MFLSIRYLVAFFAFYLLTLFSLQAEETELLVSVAPHKFFVEKIVGNTAHVRLMVPAGASSHTYEPTPKQVIAASKAKIWFCVGEQFEQRALKALKVHNHEIKAVDLRQGVAMISADPMTGHCCCHANSQDLHIWLSARQAKVQAQTIADLLIACYPEHADLYHKNLQKFLAELNELDLQIEALLEPLQNRILLVSHPAYAYFCRDYQLTQLSIEFEGKDPTPQQLNRILNLAREAHVGKVFIQQQYSSKGARLFAKELQAKIVLLDPYAEDYLNSMLQIAQAIAS